MFLLRMTTRIINQLLKVKAMPKRVPPPSLNVTTIELSVTTRYDVQ